LSDRKGNASPVEALVLHSSKRPTSRDVAYSSMAIIFALIFFPPQTATRAASPQIRLGHCRSVHHRR
jgi:hypothetical protein